MANYQYYSDFKLIDKETGIERRLSEFGGIVYNPDNNALTRNLLPDPEHITETNENQDGERYVKTVYGTRIIEVPVYFSEDLGGGELFELNRWIGKKRQQIFQWVDDEERKEIDVIYKEGIDMDIFYGEKFNGVVTLSFIAHNPYWRIRNEVPMIYNNLTVGNEIKFKNKGNSDCFPLLEITPTTSDIELTWNNLNIKLTGIDKPFYIDCERERCYEIIDGTKKINLAKYKSDDYYSFPYIQTDVTNRIKIISGSISKLKIIRNTRII